MRFTFSLFASFLFGILFSCKEDKDLLPLSPLDGTWEYSYYNSDQKVFFINQYIFSPDGGMEKSILIREAASTKVLGYYNYAIGTYELRGEEFTEDISKQYELALDAYVFYAPKDNLQKAEVNDAYPITSTLTFSLDNASFDLLYPCNDTPSSRLSSCIGALTYKRVD